MDPFKYHKPNDEQVARIEKVRDAYFALLQAVRENTKAGPVCGRYASLSVTSLEESAMWAIKSIVFEGDG